MGGNRPERTIYAITDAGRVKMVDWLSELISTPAREFTGFEAALSLMGALPPDEVTRRGEIRLNTLQQKHHAAKAGVESMPKTFPRIFLIESEFQLALLTTEITFARQLLHELKTDQLSGIKAWRRMYELRATDATPDEIAEYLRVEFARTPGRRRRPRTRSRTTTTPEAGAPTPARGPSKPSSRARERAWT